MATTKFNLTRIGMIWPFAGYQHRCVYMACVVAVPSTSAARSTQMHIYEHRSHFGSRYTLSRSFYVFLPYDSRLVFVCKLRACQIQVVLFEVRCSCAE